MILEYHRPETLEEALKLLGRKTPRTVPLGGGTVLSAPSEEGVAVVDLQALGLNQVEKQGNTLRIGAAATLQILLDTEGIPEALAKAIRHEAAYNLRQSASVAGALVASDGRSPFAVAMLALDAQLTWQPGDMVQGLGDYLPLRGEAPGLLVTHISIPLNARLAYEYVARTPADLPIVAVAVAQWPGGRTRMALGGWGKAVFMALDGQDATGMPIAAENAALNAGDEWASAEYRMDVAKTLSARALASLKEEER
jgi:CO/xanthine dehydrogenase FAD-binding subunit